VALTVDAKEIQTKADLSFVNGMVKSSTDRKAFIVPPTTIGKFLEYDFSMF